MLDQPRGSMIPVFNPGTGEKIGEVPDGGKQAVDRAVERARATFESGVWRKMPASERAKILWRFADLVDQHAEEIAQVEARNNAMNPYVAKSFVHAGTDMIRYYAGWCTKIHGQTTDLVQTGFTGVNAEYHAYTLLEPIGVAGLIIPWNGPIFCALNKLAPSLASGCSVILKPAEETPLTTLMLEKLLKEAGVPDGVANIVTGYGETTGAAMSAHPGIDKIAFTGSTEVGKLIIQAATGNLKRVTLELGGKSPVVIFNDADLAKAIPGAAMGIFFNAGQGCTAGSRIFVERGVYDQVVEGFIATAKGMTIGGCEDPTAIMGPLISAKQRERVQGLVDDGRKAGATIAYGGKMLDRPGYFFEPTVVTDVRTDMRLYREEIFGPVVTLMPFDDEDAVVAEANSSEYALAAAIWTKDVSRAHRMAKRVEAGQMWVNCQVIFDPALPFGGHKQSGWGYEYAWKGIESYMKSKSVYLAL